MEAKADGTSLDGCRDWKELEAEIKTGCSRNKLLSICRGRPLPPEYRNFVWQHCLEVHGLQDLFIHFDGVYDLPDQSIIRTDCHNFVDKLGNVEEERLSVESDLESILTLFCKSRNLKYSKERGWLAILKPLIAAKLVRGDLYNVFCTIIDNFVAREKPDINCQFHLFRLLLLYHDPEVCRFLDTKKISPEAFASEWFSTLFASHCKIDMVLNIWDIYFQLNDPFFVHFLSLVIIINARDQILCMENSSKEEIAEKLSSFPAALEADDIEDFCSLAHYYASKTPKSFTKLHHSCIYGPYHEEQKEDLERTARHLKNALCLEISVDEIIDSLSKHDAFSNPKKKPPEPMTYFVVDCRPAYQFKVGHLRSSYHLNSHLMLQNPKEFDAKVESLLSCSPEAKGLPQEADDVVSCGGGSSNILVNGGDHVCFVGEGCAFYRDSDNDSYMNMVVAHFLQKHAQYVAVCRGGYRAIHDALKNGKSEFFVGHDAKSCGYCNPECASKATSIEESQSSAFPISEAFIMQKFGKFSSAFKSTSAILKDKVITYIKNEQTPAETHVSSSDKIGRRYRNMASVFTIGDDDDGAYEEDSCHFLSSEEETKEMVMIDAWLSRFGESNSVYECFEILPDSTRPSLLCLNENHLVILRRVPNESGKAWLQNKRSLSSILKITSKKRQPQFITIKYGAGAHITPSRSGGTKSTSQRNCSGQEPDKKAGCSDEQRENSGEGKGAISVEEAPSRGSVVGDGESVKDAQEQATDVPGITVTAIDRFLIPRAGEATRDIKAHIMKLMDMLES